MKRILLIATIYRVGERIYPIIPKLVKEGYRVDVLKTAQMRNNFNWYGNDDLRVVFDNKYKEYISTIYDVDGERTLDLSNYDLILMDDDRYRNGMREIYLKAQELHIPVIGHQHGNTHIRTEDLRDGDRTSWDYLTIFGKKDLERIVKELGPLYLRNRLFLGGIPCNDLLDKYERTNKHILVIVNFLGNREAPFRLFDKELFEKIGLLELQKEYNKKVIIKIKSRADHPDSQSDFDYLDEILPKELDYEVIMDTEDDNKLIADSFMVISAPSVMALKPIQKGIPTILLKHYGQIGCFYDYKGVCDITPFQTSTARIQIHNEFTRQSVEGKEEDFIKHTIEGGIDFSSTEKYINYIRKFDNGS